MSRPRSAHAGLLAMAALTLVRPARADDAAAQAAFDQGYALMQAGKFVEACPKLEESERLDPGMGTEFRLAECYEHTSRIARASALYSKVADAAVRAGMGDRAASAIKRVANLQTRLPMLTVVVSADAAAVAGFEVTRDGVKVSSLEWGLKVPVDPGEHRFAAKAPGRIRWESAITSVEGAAIEVKVPVLPVIPPRPPPVLPPKPPGRRLSGMGIGALASGGVGVAGVVVGTVFGLSAKSRFDEALKMCGGSDAGCSPAAIQRSRDAVDSATLSTIGFVAGGAALATGVVLWVRGTPWKTTERGVAPTAGPGLAGLGLEGRF